MSSSCDRAAVAVEILDAPIDATTLRRRLGAGRPVLLRGLAAAWPATRRWTPGFFQSRYGGTVTVVERWRNGHATTEPSEYLANRYYTREPLGTTITEMAAATQPAGSVYITYADIFKDAPELVRDIEPLHVQLGFSARWPERVRRRLCARTGFWLGPASTVTTLHFDRQDNFSAQIYGRKRWTLYAPSDSANLYFPSPEMSIQLFSPVNLDAPDYDRFPLLRRAQPFVAEPGPGDVLYVPPGWWHHVKSLETAITLNFWWWSLPAARTAMWLGYHDTRAWLARRTGGLRAVTMPKQ